MFFCGSSKKPENYLNFSGIVTESPDCVLLPRCILSFVMQFIGIPNEQNQKFVKSGDAMVLLQLEILGNYCSLHFLFVGSYYGISWSSVGFSTIFLM